MSFLIGGGYDVEKLAVGLVRDKDNKILLKQTGTNDESLVRITWDTSKWAGQKVHIVVHDSSTSESWGHINVDDIRILCVPGSTTLRGGVYRNQQGRHLLRTDSNNPIILCPPLGAPKFFRDLKPFYDPIDKSWKLVIGLSNDVSGRVLLYSSKDLLSWNYVGTLYIGDGSMGDV
ncbi:hypothetical protein CEP54_007264 [Fusarium duplospermum]|uniref:Glycosyl hydrolase family 32 N-terminal domain-containing protein n=1 Tax=Fusarium duplospermum TaxID=1325734 RepID=A0A428Q212_9HYPO|nr:hypothetical protein CEP54_007264 [Fusarium duplospermum]